MTRILYWNINNFCRNKIADPNDNGESADRQTHIVNQVFLPNLPDIFIVVEVYFRRAYEMHAGVPVSEASRGGVIGLLDAIRAATNNNWMVVPALWSGKAGYCEAVAVFYNQNAVQFDGPYVFGPDYRTVLGNAEPLDRGCPYANTARPAWAPGTWKNGPLFYPNSWRNPPGGGGSCLPARASAIPGVNEDKLAGQYEFYDAFGGQIHFPREEQRSPYLTYFIDAAGRRLKIFAVHTSPKYAAQGLAQLQHIQELPPAANEVSVVVGDFNVDPFDNRAAYNGLTNNGFQLHFDSIQGGGIQLNRRPYCLTHYLPTNHATPFGTLGGVAAGPTHDVYPRLGYMGSMGGNRFTVPVTAGALDNVLTQYGGGAAVPPANSNKTIVNSVVGTPYNAVPGMVPATLADLVGGLGFASSLNAAVPTPNGQNSTLGLAGFHQMVFQAWNNFGRIRSTSDHLALLIDV
jgi:hypothetical protein